MTLFGNKQISVSSKTGEVWYRFDNEWRLAPAGSDAETLILGLKKARNTPEIRQLYYSTESYLIEHGLMNKITDIKGKVQQGIEGLIRFFSEFQFSPNFRFVNTVSWYLANRGKSSAIKYMTDYFKLFDSPDAPIIKDKLRSAEMSAVLDDLASADPELRVNNRFKIYYGPQGTGKTTQAMTEAKECMVCHSAMLPSDLMEDFKFIDGKATFDPSPLWHAMENGTPIILDEINLLPFESLRFLQSILDGKSEFIYKGRHICIKDGFKVIGTMNLYVNQMPYPLPEPLVDRCEEIIESTLDASTLLGAVFAS